MVEYTLSHSLRFSTKKSKVIYQLELTHKKYTISIKNLKVTHIHVKIFILLLVNNKNIFLYKALYLIINSYSTSKHHRIISMMDKIRTMHWTGISGQQLQQHD